MKNLRIKRVMRLDEIQRHFRLFRIMWERGDVGFGTGGYSVKFSVALTAGAFGWHRVADTHDWMLTTLGLRLHYCRSYAGVFA